MLCAQHYSQNCNEEAPTETDHGPAAGRLAASCRSSRYGRLRGRNHNRRTTRPGALVGITEKRKGSKAMTTTKARRGRPRKVESYADWMAHIDAQVDAAARDIERKPPTYAYLHPAQKRIVQMLIEHMRSLPEITAGEDECAKPDYQIVKKLLSNLYEKKYPNWVAKVAGGTRYVMDIPNGEGRHYLWMLRDCAGRAPIEVSTADDDDDD